MADDPVFEDATEARWRHFADADVRIANVRALADRLNSDFRAADGGFAAYSALPLEHRAVVSDQIVGAPQAVPSNLIEARLHEKDMNELLSGGLPFGEVTLKSHERSTRVDMAIVGFFRGVGSALDCLAAAAIGVLRLPCSIRRATFPQLRGFGTAKTYPVWAELTNLVDHYANDPAEGWLDWTLEMRHALMHRPRLLTLLLPRDTPPLRVLLPKAVAKVVLQDRLRFDPYFRRTPWLPDMQHLASGRAGGLSDAVLGEIATQTARGVFESVNQLTEELAGWLLEKWADAGVQGIPLPDAWALEADPELDFRGFAPMPFPEGLAAAVISPYDQERIALAAQLHRASLRP